MATIPEVLPDRGTLSGLYVRREYVGRSLSGLTPVITDTVRLDVDGYIPQMVASGRFFPFGPISFSEPYDWVADYLHPVGHNVWEGEILDCFQGGQLAFFPYVKARLEVSGGFVARKLKLILFPFSGGAPVSRTFEFESPYFRVAEFELDRVEGAGKVTAIDTWAHPVHSAARRETISIQRAYERAGVDLQYSPNPSSIPIGDGPGNEIWSAQELHDCMRVFWSRYRASAQWAGWLLFAHRNTDPTVAGLMFDGDNLVVNNRAERQGCAIFSDAIFDYNESDDPGNVQVGAQRSTFFAAVHEMAHCFNLMHPWKKDRNPWRPIPIPSHRSFTDYPPSMKEERGRNFWKDFNYRFADSELVFLRHAPEQFVEPGFAAFGTDHGLRLPSGRGSATSPLRLDLAVAKPRRLLEFLEPVILELKLTNTGRHPMVVDADILDDLHRLTLVADRGGGEARAWAPYVRYCFLPGSTVLHPGESIARSAFISAGTGGWGIAEPGGYVLRARLETEAGPIVAAPLPIRVASPRSRDEEYAAQDYFTGDVGRALALGGTSVMTGALDALREIVDRLGDSAAARHAMVALGAPLMRPTKLLRLPEGEAPLSAAACDERRFDTVPARPDEARALLDRVLHDDDPLSAQTFGPLEHARLRKAYRAWIDGGGERVKTGKRGKGRYAGPSGP